MLFCPKAACRGGSSKLPPLSPRQGGWGICVECKSPPVFVIRHATLAKSATRLVWTVRWLDKVARSDIWEQVCSYSVVAFYSSSIAVFSTAPPHRLVFYTSVTRPARTRPIVRAWLEFASREYISALQPPDQRSLVVDRCCHAVCYPLDDLN
jgi:hypothetical protein